jgi:hypothetical protein
MTGLLGITIRDITIDLRAEGDGGGDVDGSIWVCGAQIIVDNVTVLAFNSGGAPTGASFSCYPSLQPPNSCPEGGSITIHNSDLAPIYESGNDWSIAHSYIHPTSSPSQSADIYAYIHWGECAGDVTLTDSVLETVETDSDPRDMSSALFVFGLPDDMHIIDSTIRARSELTSPLFVTAVTKDTSLFGGEGSLSFERVLVTGDVQ